MSAGYDRRFAQTPADFRQVFALRHQRFFGGEGQDHDPWDDRAKHLMILQDGVLQATCRVTLCQTAADIHLSYTAQSYDLAEFSKNFRIALELGRFCLAPGVADSDLLRLAFGAIAALAVAEQVEVLFGCASFAGCEAGAHNIAFQALARDHLAPLAWRPGQRAAETVSLGGEGPPGDPRAIACAMPPLLRGYLGLGGVVSDHAVIDRAMKTLHVFTAVPVATIPPARLRALKALAE